MHLLPGGRAPAGDMAAGEHSAPRFAERAVELLEKGRVAAALSLCLGGTAKFPEYASGRWVLGQCYEMLGKPHEALVQYQHVDRLLPGLEQVAKALRRVGGASRPSGKAQVTEDESGIEFMLRQLQSAKQQGSLAPVPPPEGDNESTEADVKPSDARTGQTSTVHREHFPILTATLAEIYTQQGEYREAAEAYRLLIQQRPGDAGRYRERLAAVERLLEGVDKPGEA
ncbi:MAG TPA: tetratricopeptide repeat protein [Bacteroidota bacterium]|nr:tetratricopeptide repeat protein [Bacteroidota bacterium]